MTKKQLKAAKKSFPKQKRNEHQFGIKDYEALKPRG